MSSKRRDSKNRILEKGEFQREDGRYEYKYKDRLGKRRTVYSWKLVSTDRVPMGKKCDSSLREMEQKIKRDLEDGLDTYTAERTDLNYFFEKYMAMKKNLRPSTRENYIYMYTKYVSEDLGKRKITAIKYSDVKAFYMHLIYDVGFKPNSMEIIHTILNPIFTMAFRDDYIRKNPIDGLMKEIKQNCGWEKAQRHALTAPQQKAFMDFVRQSKQYKHWLPLFTFCLGTGCRVGEVIGLQWSDCFFKGGVIFVNHNMLYRKNKDGKCEFHIHATKTTNGTREVPMFDEVREALLQTREQQIKNGGCQAVVDGLSDFVFTNRYNEVYSPAALNRAIARIIRDYNKEETEKAVAEERDPLLLPHFSMHNLRHTFCTRLCEVESNIKYIQVIMGHSDASTTMDIYNEATKELKEQKSQKLQGVLQIA